MQAVDRKIAAGATITGLIIYIELWRPGRTGMRKSSRDRRTGLVHDE